MLILSYLLSNARSHRGSEPLAVTNIIMAKEGRPLKFKSVEEMQNAIDLYFLSCIDPDDKNKYVRPLTITGLANALDTSRQTLINYEARDEFFDTIKRAKSKVEQYVEEYMFTGKNQTGAIFNAKNNFDGWKDKSETDINNPDGNLKTIIIQKA